MCGVSSRVHSFAKFRRGDVQRFGKARNILDSRIPQAALIPLDVSRIEAGALGESFLCEFAGFASFADVVNPSLARTESRFRHDRKSKPKPV